MPRLYLSSFLIAFQFFFTSADAAEALSSKAQISLLTCDPGEELFTIFGHSALMVFDPVSDISEVYNWGTFDFGDPDFYPKFLRGKLLYTLDTSTPDRFIRVYQYYKRGVKQEQFLLDSIQMNLLYDAILENNKPENRYYLYDFLFDNCSTRIDEIIDKNIGPVAYPENDGYTFRDQLHQYLGGRDWAWFGIDLIIGSRADAVCTVNQQMFLPDYLSEKLGNSKIDGKPIIGESRKIVDLPLLQAKSFWITPVMVFTFLLLLEFIFLRNKSQNKWVKRYDRLWLILMAIVSIVLMFMWFGTDHKTCGNNYNLIAFSPLYILLLILLWIKREGKTISIVGVLIVLPYLLLPFIKMGIQNIYPAVMLICLISVLKFLRMGYFQKLRKYV